MNVSQAISEFNNKFHLRYIWRKLHPKSLVVLINFISFPISFNLFFLRLSLLIVFLNMIPLLLLLITRIVRHTVPVLVMVLLMAIL